MSINHNESTTNLSVSKRTDSSGKDIDKYQTIDIFVYIANLELD